MTEPATLGSVGRGGGARGEACGSNASNSSELSRQWPRKKFHKLSFPFLTHTHRKFHILVVYCFFQVAEFRTTQMDNSRDIIIMLFMSLTIARDFYNRNQVQSNYLLKKEYK